MMFYSISIKIIIFKNVFLYYYIFTNMSYDMSYIYFKMKNIFIFVYQLSREITISKKHNII